MEWIRASEFIGRNGLSLTEALALPVRLVLTPRMIFASLAIDGVLIPVLGTAVLAGAAFRANTSRGVPVHLRPHPGSPSTPVR